MFSWLIAVGCKAEAWNKLNNWLWERFCFRINIQPDSNWTEFKWIATFRSVLTRIWVYRIASIFSTFVIWKEGRPGRWLWFETVTECGNGDIINYFFSSALKSREEWNGKTISHLPGHDTSNRASGSIILEF